MSEPENSGLPTKKLRLFLSVDIENSTAYKYQSANVDKPQQWLEVFSTFFEAFPTYFIRACEKNEEYLSDSGLSFDERDINFWKNIGDEQISYIDLNHHHQAFFFVKSFLNATVLYNEELHKKNQLCIKATAWVAGFPVINAAVKLGDGRLDFIGPSIDIGFRLSKYSTPKKFVLSAELAFMMLSHKDKTSIKFFIEKPVELKGILGRKYPVIWIGDGFNPDSLEEKLLNTEDNECNLGMLETYLKVFLQKPSKQIISPFIEGTSFGSVPEWYEKEYKEICLLHKDLKISFTDSPEEKDDELKKKAEEYLDRLETMLQKIEKNR